MAARSPSGYPVASVAYFGPDDQVATKVTVSILPDETFKPSATERWHSVTSDLRYDDDVNEEILNLVEEHAVKTVLMDGRIIGCPHEEGLGMESGKTCGECAWWVNRRKGNKARVLG